ncbi:MAG: aldolase/citrate lyase family protein [Woeseiaceae bacterium]|nr:aldolase/citrate lyase family protein [Woeseiaceae bacterium]
MSPTSAPATLQTALDLGAAGIIVPHVHDRDELRRIIAATRFGDGGTRGLSTSHRAAGYGQMADADFIAANDRSITVVAQVEDATGLQHVEELAAEPALDALFIGRADLACSLGADSPHAGVVVEATRRILAAGKARGRSTGIFLPTVDEVASMLALGASLFLIDTDQGLLARALRANTAAFRDACKDAS